MAITSIRSIRNFVAGSTYVVRNQETKDPALSVDSGRAVTCKMPIPWCDNQAQFDNMHKIVMSPIATGRVPITFTIWQQGDYVRYSKDGLFHNDGDLVPGNCTVGGDRSV